MSSENIRLEMGAGLKSSARDLEMLNSSLSSIVFYSTSILQEFFKQCNLHSNHIADQVSMELATWLQALASYAESSGRYLARERAKIGQPDSDKSRYFTFNERGEINEVDEKDYEKVITTDYPLDMNAGSTNDE